MAECSCRCRVNVVIIVHMDVCGASCGVHRIEFRAFFGGNMLDDDDSMAIFRIINFEHRVMAIIFK